MSTILLPWWVLLILVASMSVSVVNSGVLFFMLSRELEKERALANAAATGFRPYVVNWKGWHHDR